LKEAYESKNLADIETAQTELNTAWTAASEEMYKASAEAGQGQPGADAGRSAPQGDQLADTVTDVDYEEVKDEKK
jgi:molecular chaperone DnaK